MRHIFPTFIFISIVIFAAVLRFTGIDWDEGQHLHPDERFIAMVTQGISWPSSFGEYLDTPSSPLNPHNREFTFFVYGTFPVFFVKAIVSLFAQNNFHHLELIGRGTSAVMDILTLLVVGFIAKRLMNSRIASLWAMLLYCLCVLPIQLSHFFATDPFVTFFITCTLALLLFPLKLPIVIGMGIFFGLSLASKISAVVFVPIIALYFGYYALLPFLQKKKRIQIIPHFLRIALLGSIFVAITFIVVRLLYPYLFANGSLFTLELNQKLLDNWKQLKSFDRVEAGFPPAIQWESTIPYLFPFANIVFFGMGIPISILVLLGSLVLLRRYRNIQSTLVLFWPLLLFAYQGGQFVKTMRYFYPLYPALCAIGGASIFLVPYLYRRLNHFTKHRKVIPCVTFIACGGIVGLALLLWPISFLSLYRTRHPRILASEWLFEHVPDKTTLAVEHWDDMLPLCLPGYPCVPFIQEQLEIYAPDTEGKWTKIIEQIQRSEYIIISSNRAYGSLGGVASRYPYTTRYYELLMNGELGFIEVKTFTNRPRLTLPGIGICLTPPYPQYGKSATKTCDIEGLTGIDDFAEEAFTVYDHPKVQIFKKVDSSIDYRSLILSSPTLQEDVHKQK